MNDNAAFHLMIVEDENVAVLQMAEFLVRKGRRITTAGGANAALALHERHPADLIVTDLRMPDGDGFHLIRTLRGRGEAIPIIVTTGHVLRDGESDMLENDATLVLRKPINLRELIQEVDRLQNAATG